MRAVGRAQAEAQAVTKLLNVARSRGTKWKARMLRGRTTLRAKEQNNDSFLHGCLQGACDR